jgi:excisionase family DNA binding protein
MTKFTDLPNKTLLTPKEAAAFLSVSLATVYRRIEFGELKIKKIGKVIRIYRESILTFGEED